MNLSEDQFKALSDADRQARFGEMRQLDLLKQVAQAGREAAAKGDTARAQKYFESLKRCGAALSGPDCLSLVQLAGKAFSKLGDAELGKLSK